jgi:hypothetical protein
VRWNAYRNWGFCLTVEKGRPDSSFGSESRMLHAPQT